MIGADRHPAGVRGDVVDAVRLAHVIRYLDALRGAIHEVNTTRVDDQATPDAGLLTRLRRRYDQGVAVGISTNLSRPWPKGNHPGLQLAKRLKRKAHQVGLFTTRLDIPATNNGSESAIGGFKLAAKVQGCWRTPAPGSMTHFPRTAYRKTSERV